MPRFPSIDTSGAFVGDTLTWVQGLVTEAKNHAGTLAYGTNLEATDATVATFVEDNASATGGALGERFVGKGELVVNANDPQFGADPTGATDSTAAINAADAYAKQKGRTLHLAGTYRIDGTVTLTTNTNATEATLNYHGTGVALKVGSDTAATSCATFVLPHVEYAVNTTWAAGTVGIEMVNLNTCQVYHPGMTRGFSTGYRFIGRGTGFAYNTIVLGYSNQNRVGHHLTQDEGGWCNQNTFLGGRTQLIGSRGAFVDDPDAHYFLLQQGSTSISGPNNNTFIGCTMEGSNYAYYRVKGVGARYNNFYNCRWEGGGSPYRIRWEQNSSGNNIHYGYEAWKIAQETDATSSVGATMDGIGGTARALSADVLGVPSGVTTTITSWGSRSQTRATYDSTTGRWKPQAGLWSIEATVLLTANASGNRTLKLQTTGRLLAMDERPGTSAARACLKVSGTWRFDGTEEFWFDVDQNSGATLNVQPYGGVTTMYAHLVTT